MMRCNAYARTTGSACRAKSLANGRCKNHGVLSTGAKTIEVKQRLSAALKSRMELGQKEKAMTGYQAWLDKGVRQLLKQMALGRERLKRIRRLLVKGK